MHGILLVDKPEEVTSSEVVRIVKRMVKPAKVGHSGTLDPAASGLIVVLIGAATRSLDYLDEVRKRYTLTVRLGEETDTGDRDGNVIATGDPSTLTLEEIEDAAAKYRGVLDQVPPHYSAIKKEGVPLYKLARKGVFPALAPRKVEIFSLTLLSWVAPLLAMDLVCSKGTYARALARDLGRDLGVGGRLERLRRTEAGLFAVADAATLADIAAGGRDLIEGKLITLAKALAHIPDISVTAPELRRLMRGNTVTLSRFRFNTIEITPDQPGRIFKIASDSAGLVVLVRPEPKGSDIAIRPVKVFKTWDDS